MDHSKMGHGDMGDGHTCSMNMLFTWDTKDLCIVFRGWRIHSTASLIGSLIGVILLTAGYELVRELSRRYEASTQRRIEASTRDPDIPESGSFPWLGRNAADVERQSKIVKAAFYAVQVFYSFFIMLLFMTYNGWIMLAVAAGAFIGYMAFGGAGATKSVACH